ncbi:MAG: hypothetical protein HQK51_04860 [Oligoflexia bacterium]|nr:hypothetical protein [Oligoflexia bacterium]
MNKQNMQIRSMQIRSMQIRDIQNIFITIFFMLILSLPMTLVLVSCGIKQADNNSSNNDQNNNLAITEELQAAQSYNKSEILLAKTVCDSLQSKKIKYTTEYSNQKLKFNYDEECTSCEDVKTSSSNSITISDDITDATDDFRDFCTRLRAYSPSSAATDAAAAAAATGSEKTYRFNKFDPILPTLPTLPTLANSSLSSASNNAKEFSNTVDVGIEKLQYTFYNEVNREHSVAGTITVIPVRILRVIESDQVSGVNGEINYEVNEVKNLEIVSSKDSKWRGIVYSVEKKTKCSANSKRTNEYKVEKIKEIL